MAGRLTSTSPAPKCSMAGRLTSTSPAPAASAHLHTIHVFDKWLPDDPVAQRQLNKVVADERVLRMWNKFDVGLPPPHDLRLLKLALVHRSAKNDVMVATDNEELEFLGDSLINAATTCYIVSRYVGDGEAVMSKLRARIVNNDDLGELAQKLGFGRHVGSDGRSTDTILLGKSVDADRGRDNPRILASALEAFIGAMYLTIAAEATEHLKAPPSGVLLGSKSGHASMTSPASARRSGFRRETEPDPVRELSDDDDLAEWLSKSSISGIKIKPEVDLKGLSGAGRSATTSAAPPRSSSCYSVGVSSDGVAWQAVQRWVCAALDAHVDIRRLAGTNEDFKSALQVYIQHEHQDLPSYQLVAQADVPSNGLTFVSTVTEGWEGGRVLGEGRASDKKTARQAAARAAANALGLPEQPAGGNFVGALNEFYQKSRRPTPQYEEKEERLGPRFYVSVHAPGPARRLLGKGSGPTKAAAEQEAARDAMERIVRRMEAAMDPSRAATR